MTTLVSAILFTVLAQTPIDAPSTAPADTSTSFAPPKQRSDAEITVEVEGRFIQEKTIGAKNINTNTSNGIVTLSGSVEDEYQRDRAEELALQTPGVVSVINNLIVVPHSYGEKERRTFKEKLSDRGVTTAVRSRLIWYREPRGMKVGIKTINGVVTLSGLVEHEEDRTKIEETVATTKGVVEVINNLIVQPKEDATIPEHIGRQFSDEWFEGKVETAIFNNKHLSLRDVDVEVEDGVCVLTGTVNTAEEKELAETLAQSVKGVHEVRNEIRLYEDVITVQPAAPQTSGNTDILDTPSTPTPAPGGLHGSDPADDLPPPIEATELPAP